jgi:hypothetical protein
LDQASIACPPGKLPAAPAAEYDPTFPITIGAADGLATACADGAIAHAMAKVIVSATEIRAT